MLSSEADASSIAVVSLKAFGDYVIARSALRQAGPAGAAVHLIIGDHLLPLHAALGDRTDTHVLAHGTAVPAMFDVKRAGVPAALCSAVRLRSSLRRVTRTRDLRLVFDRIGPRERFLAAGERALALPESDNIYRAYARFFGVGEVSQLNIPIIASTRSKVGIFPGSRIAAKQLPQPLIARLASACELRGAKVTVFCLEGEPQPMTEGSFNVAVVPRSFEAMRDAIQGCDYVISADSMPAHLAEFVGKRVFVVSPVSNSYWLPLTSLIHGHWALFGEAQHIDEKLAIFLAGSYVVGRGGRRP